MEHYDYKAIPAPRRCKKAKGVREPAELFAMTITDAINEQAREGWEYVRAETLAAEAPRGIFRRAAEAEVALLIFRRFRASREPILDSHGYAAPAHMHAAEPMPAARPPLSRQEARHESRHEPSINTPRTFEERVQAASLVRREPRVSDVRNTESHPPQTATNVSGFASPLRPAPKFGPSESS